MHCLHKTFKKFPERGIAHSPEPIPTLSPYSTLLDPPLQCGNFVHFDKITAQATQRTPTRTACMAYHFQNKC